MTAAFVTAPWESIHNECYRHFGVDAVSRGARGGRKDRKRDQITNTILRFRSVMNGPNPPRTKQEAVRAVSGIGALLLSYLFRQLAVMVVEWLWDRLKAEEASFTVAVRER